jgi:hypothetical protein
VIEDRDGLLDDDPSAQRVDVPPVHGRNHPRGARRSETDVADPGSDCDGGDAWTGHGGRTVPALVRSLPTAFGRRGAVTVRGWRPWLLSPPRRHEIPEGPT